MVTRLPLPAGCHTWFRGYVPQHPTSVPNGVSLFVHPIGPAARLGSPRKKEQVTGNKFFHYMLQINPLMVAGFNAQHERRADCALWQRRPAPGRGTLNERGTMYPFTDLPEVSLVRTSSVETHDDA